MFKMITLLVLSFTLMAEDAPVMLPQKAEAIVKASTKKLNDLQIQMNKVYIEESVQLEKVKIEFAKKGDLDSANSIAAKIKEVNALIVDPVGKGLFGGNDQIVGKWKIENDPFYMDLKFDKSVNGMVNDQVLKSGTYSVNENKITITWNDGSKEFINTNKVGNSNKYIGSNNSGKQYTLIKN